MNTQSIQIFYNRKYGTLVNVLFTVAAIFLLAGIVLPGAMLSDFNEIIDNNPGILVMAIYIALLFITFSSLSFIIAISLKKPSNETLWLENTLSVIAFILITIGIVGFFIAASNGGSIKELRQIGIAGGVLFFLFHLKIGLLCFGAASIHNKYNSERESISAVSEVQDEEVFTLTSKGLTRIESSNKSKGSSKVVFCTSCGKQVETEPGDEMCYHCGEKL